MFVCHFTFLIDIKVENSAFSQYLHRKMIELIRRKFLVSIIASSSVRKCIPLVKLQILVSVSAPSTTNVVMWLRGL